MKSRRIIFSLCLFAALFGRAVPITLFMNLDRYWERGKEVIIARCVSVPTGEERYRLWDGVYLVEVEVLKTLKGGSPIGKKTIATIYGMKPEATYLLYSMGGTIAGTDFLALPELSVVELPSNFELAALEGKPPIEQVSTVFSARLDYLEHLQPVEKPKDTPARTRKDEKELLKIATRLVSKDDVLSPDGMFAANVFQTRMSPERRDKHVTLRRMGTKIPDTGNVHRFDLFDKVSVAWTSPTNLAVQYKFMESKPAPTPTNILGVAVTFEGSTTP